MIGGPYGPYGSDPGAAWVFTRTGSTWSQQGEKLVGDCTSGCGCPNGTGEVGDAAFGQSVALSSDGNTALIGAGGDNSYIGAAWVFTRSGSSWSQQGSKLTGPGTCPGDCFAGSSFGYSVALSSDGNTALIGGPLEGPVKERRGYTRARARPGPSRASSGAAKRAREATFGASVALSSDGDTALIGGPQDNGSVGAAWVFTRSGAAWAQQGAKLTGGGEVGEGNFGEAAALSGDGNTALIGGPTDSGNVGAAWVFTRSGSIWTQEIAKLTGGGEVGEGYFGDSVVLSSDGDTALIGGPFDESSVGAAWVFTRSGSAWAELGVKLTGTGEVGGGRFGQSVALSSTGGTALVGGQFDSFAGAVWVSVDEEPPTAETQDASELTGDAATVNASVNPNGATVKECKFEYGTTTS